MADALISAGEPDWRLVAGHYQRAERFDEAASAYQQASIDARRRGALAEARSDLTQALTQLDHALPGPERDRLEIALRRERGRLTSAAEGYQSRAAATDFERCLRLAGTDLRNEELFATLVALHSYYVARADLRRAAQVLESLRTGVENGRRWFRPVIEALFGLVALLRGNFDTAASDLEAAIADLCDVDQHMLDAEWFRVSETIAYAHNHLALTRLVHGDLTGAETDFAHAERRAEELGFPQGPYTSAYTGMMEIGMRVEAGQLDRAAILADDLSEQAERYGLDLFRLVGVTWQAAVGALAALGADDVDQTAVADHIATVTTFLDSSRRVGLNNYLTMYEAVLGRLLIAAGQPEVARERLDTGLQLARDTGMCFYDAELMRLRAHTHTDPDARRADIGAALALARRQGATLFELRAALDDFELHGQPARAALTDVVSRFPPDSGWPELARAQAALDQTAPKTG